MRCRAEYSDRPETCGACLLGDLLAPMPDRLQGRDVASAPRRRGGVVAAHALRPTDRRAPYGPPADVWEIGDPHAVLHVGPSGGGKSTLATRMLVSAARRVPVLYVAAEEGHAHTLASRLERAGLDDLSARRLSVSDARTLLELEEDLAASPAAIVVLDSVTELRAKPEEIATMLAGRSWIAIAHVNSRGGAQGGPSWPHAVDTVIEVVDGVARPLKNRFGPMTQVRVFDEEAA